MRRLTRAAIFLVSTTLVFACSSGSDDDDDTSPDAYVPVPDAAVSIDAAETPDAAATPDAAPRPDGTPQPDADMTDADTTDADTTDAEPGAADADTTDAADSDACLEFATPDGTISSYPGTFDGNVNDTSASQIVAVASGDCAEENAPYGVATPGPEQVVMLSNLVSGTEYMVSLDAAEDLSFYVATSCTGDDGPDSGECLLFVDTGSNPEIGTFTEPTFVAPTDGVAYVVVDRYTTPPTDGTYTLTVSEPECATSFDCTDPGTPVCDLTTRTCVAVAGDCVGDDGVEDGDDAPGGATALTADTTVDAHICDSPATESDWYKLTAPGDENVLIQLSWTGGPSGQEIYGLIYEADGTPYTYFGGDTSPVVGVIPHAAAADWYVEIFRYGTDDTAVTDYTIGYSIVECFWPGADCTTAGETECADYTCGASTATTCTGDDTAVEDDDDGAGGATVLSPTLDGAAVDTTAHICSAPTSGGYSIESDFYSVTIGDGEQLSATLSWTGDDDIDLYVYDMYGLYVADAATYDNPEVLSTTELGAGTYFLEVWTYDPADVTASTEYTLSVQRATAP